MQKHINKYDVTIDFLFYAQTSKENAYETEHYI